MIYNEEEFLNKRIQGWRRLALLCDKAARSFRELTGAEIVEYVRLYRQTSGDLAYLSSHSSNRDVVAYLNSLVSRAYGQLYRSRTASFAKILNQGLWLAADAFRRNVLFFVFAVSVFAVAAVYTFGMMTIRPETRHYFIPPSDEENFKHWTSGERLERTGDESIMMTGMYASNNPKVGLVTISLAAGTAGLGSTYIIWRTGSQVGALSFEMAKVGRLGFLFSSIAPHGVSEIGGIFVAGAAGYVIAFGLLFPRSRRLTDSLKHAGKDAFILGVLALVMIFCAAPIEGFFSFNPDIPQSIKVVFALCALTAWGSFLGFYGRNQTATDLGLA